MKHQARFLCVIAIAFLTVNASAGPGGNGPGVRGPQNAAQMAQMMIASHDRNGDGALNVQELASVITAMQQQNAAGNRMGNCGSAGENGPGARGGAAGTGEGRRPGPGRPGGGPGQGGPGAGGPGQGIQAGGPGGAGPAGIGNNRGAGQGQRGARRRGRR